MKSAPTALIDYLNAARASNDVQLIFADTFTFTLRSGAVLAYTNSEITFTYSAVSFLGDSILIDGLKYKAAVGLEVDSQQVTVAARSDETIASAQPFLQALRNGAFDGATVQRQRVFFSDRVGGTAVGGVILFQGRFGKIDKLGRTTAQFTVNSDLVLLDIDMPRNIYQPTCLHTLYDAGCTLSKSSFGTNGSVGAGSTASLIQWAGANGNFQQGTISFTSGVNNAVSATVVNVTNADMTLGYPLESAPAVGDDFTVYYGCDHTPGTCQSTFDNLINFRGFPYVPPPQMAI